MENRELNHHGVLGMKWGRRRYQNKDGTLTPRGKKRYNKEMEKLKAEEKVLKNKQRTKAKFDKLESKKKELDELREQLDGPKKFKIVKREAKAQEKAFKKLKKKPLEDLSDDELRTVVTRLELEKRYSDLSVKQTKKGSDFISKIGGEVIAPAAADIGKQVLKSFLAKGANKVFELDGENLEKVYANNKKK